MIKFKIDDVRRVFRDVELKTVTKTDISKAAYVVSAGQQRILAKAGFKPGVYPRTTRVPLTVLGTGEAIEVSYYGSQRVGSGRAPEYRMGRFLPRVKVGDNIALATDERDVFICLVSPAGLSGPEMDKAYEEAAVIANEQLPLNNLIARALRAKRKPVIRQTITTSYNRDPAIVALANRRSEYKCEMPGCNYVGFKKKDRGQFIETHHITSLAEGGDDAIDNAAALCPTCHRIMHYAYDREKRREILKIAVKKANARIGIQPL